MASLTYEELLIILLDIRDQDSDDLKQNVTVYDSHDNKYNPISIFYKTPVTDVLDAGHLVLLIN